MHAERERPLRDELADSPKAEDPERLLVHLDAGELRSLPLAARQRGVRLRHVASERSSSAIVCSAAVITFDWGALATTIPRFVGRGDVDVVHPDAGPADGAQPGAPCRSMLGVELRRRADENALVAPDALGPVRSRLQPTPSIDVEVLAEEVDSGIADLLGDENLHGPAPGT